VITPSSLDPTLTTLADDELIAGLSPADGKRRDPVAEWLISRGFQPSTQRVLAATLWDDWQEWLAQQVEFPGKPPTRAAWAQELRRRFKHSRQEGYWYYYVTTIREIERDSEGPVVKKGRGGNPGGANTRYTKSK
jgi:hypothetical protein